MLRQAIGVLPSGHEVSPHFDFADGNCRVWYRVLDHQADFARVALVRSGTGNRATPAENGNYAQLIGSILAARQPRWHTDDLGGARFSI